MKRMCALMIGKRAATLDAADMGLASSVKAEYAEFCRCRAQIRIWVLCTGKPAYFSEICLCPDINTGIVTYHDILWSCGFMGDKYHLQVNCNQNVY